MSASNWAICPRCYSEAITTAEAERARVMGLYGNVSVEEFDEARTKLTLPNPEDFRTFREDYEFTGADDGLIFAAYEGQCTTCGLTARLEASQRFWPDSG